MKQLLRSLNNGFWLIACALLSVPFAMAEGDSFVPTVIPNEGDFAKHVKDGNFTWEDVQYFIGHVIKFVLGISGIVALCMVILGGFYMAAGSPDDKSKGKSMVTYALMGLVVVALAWFILDVFVQVITT